MIEGLFGSVAWESPMWPSQQQQMYDAWNALAHSAYRQAAYDGYARDGMQNVLSRQQMKLNEVHKIAADVRARHPEMQVKRLGNDCAARSD